MSNKGVPQTAVGGQAVIEGVMMRTPIGSCVAVRRPEGTIVARHRPWQSWTRRVRPLGWPFLRGVVVLVESLSGGMEALKFSAEEAAVEEEPPKKKGGSAINTALLSSLALFGFLPEGGGGRGSAKASFAANLAMLGGLALALLLFKGVPHGVAVWTGYSPTETLFHVIDGGVKLLLVIGYITAISRMKDIQRVFEYHGAEHKSIRVFEQGFDLTVDNARKMSRLHPRCGTSFLVVVVIASVLVYIALSPLIPRVDEGWLFQIALIFVKILLLAPVSAIAYEFNRLAGKYWQSPISRFVTWPGIVMQQLLTTREPSDDQLEVALVSLKVALEEKTENAKEWKLDVFDSFDAFESTLSKADVPQPETA